MIRVWLRRAATAYAPVKQASSLGAEDVVITHLINSLELDIPVFVLETGMLHPQTLALLATCPETTSIKAAFNRDGTPGSPVAE